MKIFRSVLFWMHLVAGLVAGISVGIMCFTGTVIAFQDEIVAWSERDARNVTPPAENATRLPLADLQRKLGEAQPEFRAASVTMQNDPTAAIAFSAGREGGYYVNPYTGDIRQPASSKTHDFMELMLQWHRFLGRDGDQRAIGKVINGTCNLAFCFLALSGLYLWMPRTWSWRSARANALFNLKSNGRARDFNWHNVIGLWCAPLFIILTLTAIPISFRWGSNFVYRLVGEEPPVQGAPAAGAALEIKRPTPESRSLGYDAILAQVQRDFPQWTTISLRSGAQQRAPTPGANTSQADQRPAGGARTPQPITVTVRIPDVWPRTATTTLTLNPFTGEVLKREGFGDFSTGRQLRTWTRFLHTGQALGWPGQFVAGLACLGGCFLVYTGLALSCRRFFGKRITSTSRSS